MMKRKLSLRFLATTVVLASGLVQAANAADAALTLQLADTKFSSLILGALYRTGAYPAGGCDPLCQNRGQYYGAQLIRQYHPPRRHQRVAPHLTSLKPESSRRKPPYWQLLPPWPRAESPSLGGSPSRTLLPAVTAISRFSRLHLSSSQQSHQR